MYILIKHGSRQVRKTTIRRKLLVKWKDGVEQWVPLKGLKKYNIVDAAEFLKSRRISNEITFHCWVNYVLSKRDRILAVINSRLKKDTYKYGVHVPRNVQHIGGIYKANSNTLWVDTIKTEMYNISLVFEILNED